MNRLEVSVEYIRHRAIITVNNMVEQLRSKNCTFILGQELVYMEKLEEAIDYSAAKYPKDASSYPHIYYESIALNVSPKELAMNILASKTKWTKLSAQIEAVRVKAKRDIEQSVDPDDIKIIKENALNDLQNLNS